MADAEQILREWQQLFDVYDRLGVSTLRIPDGIQSRAYRAYRFIRRHEEKQQGTRDGWTS